MNEYRYKVQQYEKTIADINAKTSIIQQEDRTLELRLKQLDTEQNALSTEMEAVKKLSKTMSSQHSRHSLISATHVDKGRLLFCQNYKTILKLQSSLWNKLQGGSSWLNSARFLLPFISYFLIFCITYFQLCFIILLRKLCISNIYINKFFQNINIIKAFLPLTP